VTGPKTPLDERALDGLIAWLPTRAVVSYQEQRLKLQVARKLRDHSTATPDLAHRQTFGDDEIA